MIDSSSISYPKFSAVGDTALLIELGDTLDDDTNTRVFALDSRIHMSPLDGVLESVPGYASLLVRYDPYKLTLPEVRNWVQELLLAPLNQVDWTPKRVEIPVRYGGENGPDLGFVAESHGLSVSEVVQRHTQPIYRVGMMGFTPGFAYLMGMDAKLATPRLANPRTFVPAGSVGIAGAQTGVYPLDSPGGWQLIGRTDLAMFTPDHEPHFLLSPGDEVLFVAVDIEAAA